MQTPKRKSKLLLIVGIPILFALIVRFVFGVNSLKSLYSVMTVTFLFLLPVGIGALTIALSTREKVAKLVYRFFMPWLPILGFLLLTILFSFEGLACWLMILPIFLIAASIGGLIAGHFKLRKPKREKLYVSLMAALPLLVSPIEQSLEKKQEQYQAYTSIEILGSKETIWDNVTRVHEIPKELDNGGLTRLLGFPRPIKAELDFEGVGAYRKAIFDKGLIFHETVLQYDQEKKMTFSIMANPYEIPSATMDEHIVVGGEFFDVLRGTYEMEQISNGSYRLHLYSNFKLTTTFNFYASVWATWIMKDIQNNILTVIKQRAENNATKVQVSDTTMLKTDI